MNLPHWKQTLERAGLSFVEGLTPDQLRDCERLHNVRFPPDLEEMLRFALPMGKGCPDWRNPSDPAIAEMLARPLDGILFDVEQNAFWPRELGERPSDLNAAFRLITAWIDAAPRLIPVMGHRYLPDRPHDAGNPVFSVSQTDIIYYGRDLAEYFENEYSYYFRGPGSEYRISQPVRRIEIWSPFAEDEYDAVT